MQFTQESIAALELPAGKSDHIEFDAEMPGFGIRLRAGGKRAWIVQYRAQGRQRRETLGDARRLNLKAARAAAQKRFAQVALGGDPQADKAAEKARAADRFGPLAERYLQGKKGVVRANTFVADSRYLKIYFKPFHSLSVDAVNRRLVASRLSAISVDHGTTAAARARQSLSAFFSWLMGEGIAEQNPVIGTNNPGAGLEPRERVLDPDEMRAIWAACRDDDFGRIVRLLMLTGARRDEIGGLRWSEIDVDRGLLNIPGTRTKNHRALELSLPAAAVAIIKAASRREGRDFLFGGSGGAFSAWSYSTLQLGTRISELNRGPIAAWRLHDIRRTIRTGMGALGVQPHIAEAVLNHLPAKLIRTYDKNKYEAEKRAALAIWADHVHSIVEGTERKIVSLNTSAA